VWPDDVFANERELCLSAPLWSYYEVDLSKDEVKYCMMTASFLQKEKKKKNVASLFSYSKRVCMY
jgi:hypothetical protein